MKRAQQTIRGRRSIFREKAGGGRVQGLLTSEGFEHFEAARARLAKLAKREVDDTSDADTIEYLARGDANTKAYLKKHQ